jgi:hypothetical protein
MTDTNNESIDAANVLAQIPSDVLEKMPVPASWDKLKEILGDRPAIIDVDRPVIKTPEDVTEFRRLSGTVSPETMKVVKALGTLSTDVLAGKIASFVVEWKGGPTILISATYKLQDP